MRSINGMPASPYGPPAPALAGASPAGPETAIGVGGEQRSEGLAEQETCLADPVEEDVFLGSWRGKRTSLERLGGMKEKRLPTYDCSCDNSRSLLSQWPLTSNPASMMVSNLRRRVACATLFLLLVLLLMALMA
mmetsp:Transcript_79114/g.218928  ORF Transcript_79114/g.218928 Transcript_79114/m.218928 type:complete len:134 (+) Transcript_79114:474-875(+)